MEDWTHEMGFEDWAGICQLKDILGEKQRTFIYWFLIYLLKNYGPFIFYLVQFCVLVMQQWKRQIQFLPAESLDSNGEVMRFMKTS